MFIVVVFVVVVVIMVVVVIPVIAVVVVELFMIMSSNPKRNVRCKKFQYPQYDLVNVC